MLKFTLVFWVLAVSLSIHSNAAAQGDPEAEEFQALRQELGKLRAGQARIEKELEEIKGLLRGARRRREPAKFEPAVVDISSDPAKGQRDARVTLIDFTDYE